MPAQPARRRALQQLNRRIVSARTSIRRLQTAIEQRHAFVLKARLSAAKLRLAQLCIERQRVRAEP